MKSESTYLRMGGQLLPLSRPLVMAIVNVTPDSFYAESRSFDRQSLRRAVEQAVSDGADILDIGACSTRPSVQSGAGVADEQEEWRRLQMALEVLDEMAVDVPVSVDTFRPAVAERAIREYGVEMINDISGGSQAIFETVARYNVAYVLTYNRPACADASTDHLLLDAMDDLSRKVDTLHRMGVSDVVIDPGFGFNQTVEQSLYLLDNLHALTHIGCPVLAGVSRKRMAYQPAGLTPATCLEQTLELERIALRQGAAILRVHDVLDTHEMINDRMVNDK